MGESRTLPANWITGFAGENRVAPDHRLPPNISPDALNIDYIDGSLKKRPGLHRRHLTSISTGGVLVSDTRAGNRYLRLTRTADLNFAAGDPFEYELAFLFDEKLEPDASLSGLEFDLIKDTNGNTGVRLCMRWNGTAWRLRAYLGQSAPGFSTVDHTTDLAPHTVYAVRVKKGIRTATALDIDLNGTTVTGTYANNFVYNSGTYLQLGNDTWTFSPGGLRVVIDDFRIWLNPATDVKRIIDENSCYRAMSDAEVADAGSTLAGYWRFDEEDDSGNYPSDGGTVTGSFVPVENLGQTVERGRALVRGGRASVITGMAPIFDDNVETGLLICTEDTIYTLTYATDTVASVHLLDKPSLTRWSFARHTNYILMANGESQNLRYDATNGVRQLSFSAPTTAFTATVSATGGTFSGAGVVQYLIAFYDSTTGQESYPATTAVSATLAAGTDKVTLASLPVSNEPGVDSYRFYRTEVGGSRFYLLKTIAYGLSASYIDTDTGTAGDGSLDTNSPWSKYKGHAGPSRFLLEHNGCILACNQDGYSSRVMFSEPGTAGDFYFNNFFWAGLGDGDELTGGIVVGGVPILFKRNSIWVVTGSGPSTYAARPLYQNVGCVHHATIGASQFGVYYQAIDGVYRLPLPLQSGPPVDLTENSQRSLFGSLRDDKRLETFGMFDPIEQRYYTRLTTGSDDRVLVYDQRNEAWALWDLAADSFAIARPDGGAPEILVGHRGYVTELSSSKYNDGLSAEGSTWTSVSISNLGNSDGTLLEMPTGTTLPHLSSGGPFTNLRVRITYPDGSTEWGTVWYSDDARIYLQTPVTSMTTGSSVTFEPIASEWRTGRQTYDNGLDDNKNWQRMRFLFEDGGTATLNAYVTGRNDSATAATQTFTIATNARTARQQLAMRGHEVIFGFTENSADKTYKMAAYQITFQQAEPRP